MDVAPEIYENIMADFRASVTDDKELNRLAKKIANNKGTQSDVTKLTQRFGVHSSDALKKNLILADLPDEKLYWNIAEKTIKPLLEQCYGNINRYAAMQLSTSDQRANIAVRILRGQGPEVRIDQVMNFAVNSLTQPELDNALTDPVIAANRKFYDDFQKANAQLREDLGLREMVVRQYDDVGLHNGKDTCEWCLQRAGTWDYSEARENGVFERHPACGCTIEVYTEKGTNRQTDWTTNTWEMQ